MHNGDGSLISNPGRLGRSSHAMTRIALLGDVYLTQAIEPRLLPILPYVFNLEAPLCASGRPHPGKVNLRISPHVFRATFAERPPTAVCLANNHVMDYGADALAETLSVLSDMGIGFFGAGSADDNCHNPLVVDVGGVAVALMGYVCATTSPVLAASGTVGAAPLSLDRIRSDLRLPEAVGAARRIVVLHWGAEEVRLPKPADVQLGRAIADAGADLIVGHHAHCVQPHERHRNVPVFYGLGNWIMPDLDVPGRFDASGTPRDRFRKLQHSWNRYSLGVAYDLRTGAVETFATRFKRGRLVPAAVRVRPLQAVRAKWLRYEWRFRFAFLVGKLRPVLANLARRPHLPGPRQIVKLFTQIAEALRTETFK